MKYIEEWKKLHRGEWIEWALCAVCIALAFYLNSQELPLNLTIIISLAAHLFGLMGLLFQERRAAAFWAQKNAFNAGFDHGLKMIVEDAKRRATETLVARSMN